MSTQLASVAKLQASSLWERYDLLLLKRVVDILVSVFLLILLFPLLIVLALLVKATSPGPLLYRWKVVGKQGRPFTGYKFRSMCANADALKPALHSLNEMDGPVFKLTNDPRLTRFGAWMRRHSLDELPQLYSVLKGDMSLVGPRPPLLSEYIQFSEYQRQKLAVKPGITCLWQVNGRNAVSDFDQWVRMDLEYIQNWSPLLDMRILAKTFWVVLMGTGK